MPRPRPGLVDLAGWSLLALTPYLIVRLGREPWRPALVTSRDARAWLWRAAAAWLGW